MPKIVPPRLLRNSKKLLHAYITLQTKRISGARNLLDNYSKEKLERFNKERLPNSMKLLNSFKSSNIHSFKIFNIAGFTANEKNLSDAIAALLDPIQTHQLNLLPLKNVLKAIQHRAPAKISFILRHLNDREGFILLEREKNGSDTIPDISISSKNFLIFIENKKRGGSETVRHNTYQTERQWRRLLSRGKEMGLNEKGLLGIYLTPEGGKPTNSNFVSLSAGELVTAIRKATRLGRRCSCKAEINTF